MPHGFSPGHRPPPAHALRLGYQNDGIGHLWLAVANTEGGQIPGKATEDTCWYSLDGNEHSTKNFEWVTAENSITTIPNEGSGPPASSKSIGYYGDRESDLYSAIANTEKGTIPGKASNNTCWYPYGGKEYETNDFAWLAASVIEGASEPTQMEVDYVRGEIPPANGLDFGYQNDGSGKYWVAVAETQWGRIPGKARDSTCWYSYGGAEYDTNDFYWIVSKSMHSLIKNRGDGPPPNTTAIGKDTHGRCTHYAAIASTKWGRIPGKAVGNSCSFSHGGKEHETNDFEWVMYS